MYTSMHREPNAFVAIHAASGAAPEAGTCRALWLPVLQGSSRCCGSACRREPAPPAAAASRSAPGSAGEGPQGLPAILRGRAVGAAGLGFAAAGTSQLTCRPFSLSTSRSEWHRSCQRSPWHDHACIIMLSDRKPQIASRTCHAGAHQQPPQKTVSSQRSSAAPRASSPSRSQLVRLRLATRPLKASRGGVPPRCSRAAAL